ncbi:NAD(P)H-binding protein [Pseudonocardia sp. DSM 110487]|uniref:NAD(P)H-binding protein n=1 Tax=Pseudonocardia sp. DSM 110487 TaxID=2865833 RepID=UPI001C6A3B14|nr:NAD(P)H-binding protein [Pseudonocardia sp. DSM 110487]QYN37520.1 NAD(P)H-binding protein [Pseudonocardia sp. DSM 110487]
MILVTGATGNIGRLVVDELLAAGATDIRALTNNPEKAALPPEVEVVRGYLGRVETLHGVFDGVEKMYLAPLEATVREVTTLAAKAGVRHIVDVSGPKDSWWAPVATAVEESGVAWTHLSPGEFMDNSLMWAEQIRTTGQVRDGYPDSANAQIDLGDIAAVAAVALLEDGHAGKEYLLTGPETLTRAEKVRQIGEALGREIPYITLDHDDAVAALEPSMGEFARWYVEGMRDLTEHPQQANRVVEDVTGRPATTFAQWARRRVDEFR